VHPFPLAPHRRVHDGEFLLLDGLGAVLELPKIAVELSPHAVGRHPLPLERICFLRYSPAVTAVQETRMSPAQSVLELLRNSLSIKPDRAREIALLAQLVSPLPSIDFRFPSPEAAAAWVHGGSARGTVPLESSGTSRSRSPCR
jgi:hypothetical protein